MATKLVSTLAIFFILVLVISETRGTEAHGDACLKEYDGEDGFALCAPLIYPPFCYTRCRSDKGAKSGRCVRGATDLMPICLCDYCGGELPGPFIRRV
ncbi:PREDICTED: defensin-like protein 193 [Camelina sativa]|uniref:Defensin-like protein 193 n=1 Tax=Camelina sativa TaxID=90675 RepID=A0ABM0YUX3_CAMSA|nr:PREDICTED: defensin-like protein 193 [Camelina sativa]